MAALPPLDALIRAGSGLLFLGLGVFVLAMARGLVRVAFGTYLAAFGLLFVVVNLVTGSAPESERLKDALRVPLYLLQMPCIAVLAGTLPAMDARDQRRSRLIVLAGAAITLVACLARAELGKGALGVAADLAEYTAHGMGLAWLLALALSYPALPSGPGRAAVALLSAGLGIYLSYRGGFGLAPARFAAADGPVQAYLVLQAVGFAAFVALWLRNTAVARGAERPARDLVLLILIVALVGLGLSGFVDPDAADTTGGIGVARILGAALVAWAILGHDLLGLGLRPRTVERGTLAAATLAVLLIVAQVAQNFLSAEYGLLMGGVVAGALLVAARPIERALERRPGETRAAQPDAAKEDAFRAAVRMALRDRRITREEELHLHRVAQHMGIPAGRAHELLIEVEREAGPGGPS